MGAIEVILRQLDDAWGHRWESLTAVLTGVADEAWAWQPPGYHDAPAEALWPPPGSIGWHVVHLTACKRAYTRRIRDRGTTVEVEDGPYGPPAARKDVLAALAHAHVHLRGAITALGEEDLALEVDHELPLAGFLAMAIRHDSWHAGQIAVVRRLYRAAATRAPKRPSDARRDPSG